MCDRCKAAGKQNADGNAEKAELTHEQCPYPDTCTCAHKTGDGHLNLPAARPLRADATDENPEDDDEIR